MVLRTWARLRFMVRVWNTWLLILGLAENLNKLKIICESAQTPPPDTADPLAAHIAMEVRVLGIDFCARRCLRQSTTTVADRVQQAIRRIERIAVLRFLSWALRRVYIVSLAISKAAWGWWLHGPPRYLQLDVQSAIQKAAAPWHGGTAVPLRCILRGPEMDLGFSSGLGAMRAWLQARIQLADEVQYVGRKWTRRIETWFAQYGGTITWMGNQCTWRLGPYEWTPTSWPTQRKLIEHELREVWRRHQWLRFVTSRREDACALREHGEDAYPQEACRIARELYLRADTHQRRVLEGGAVSFATLAVWRKRRGLQCPCCGYTGRPDWPHTAWHCDINWHHRPRQPATMLQRWLGWPSSRDAAASQVLQHLGAVRQLVLSYR
jgi:hypothetical protein